MMDEAFSPTIFHVGDIEILHLPEIEFVAPIEGLMPAAEAGHVVGQASSLVPYHIDPISGTLRYSVHSWIVRTNGVTMLIDACCGNHKHRTQPEQAPFAELDTPYLDRLAALGVSPEDVDFVMCTHLHVDHVGWNTRLENGTWVPTFVNARYLFSRCDRDFWDPANREGFPPHPNDGVFADSVAPVLAAGQAILVDEGYEPIPGFVVVARPGHTPGHINLSIGRGQPVAIFSGDTMHHPLQVYHPDLNSAFCEDPLLAYAARIGLLEQIADTDTILFPAHFPMPHAGRVVRDGSGYRFIFLEASPR
jgi:glyoxylase-like metal-dependent hydrolase (beta-lactamase superfamily II)